MTVFWFGNFRPRESLFQKSPLFGPVSIFGTFYHLLPESSPGVAWGGLWLEFSTLVPSPILQMSVACCTNLMYEFGWSHSLNLSCLVVQVVELFPSVLNFLFRKNRKILSQCSPHHHKRKRSEHNRQWMWVQK